MWIKCCAAKIKDIECKKEIEKRVFSVIVKISQGILFFCIQVKIFVLVFLFFYDHTKTYSQKIIEGISKHFACKQENSSTMNSNLHNFLPKDSASIFQNAHWYR